MIEVTSFREFHSGVSTVASALEALYYECEDQTITAAVAPALQMLRHLLDVSDSIAGPDLPVSSA